MKYLYMGEEKTKDGKPPFIPRKAGHKKTAPEGAVGFESGITVYDVA